MMNLTTNDSVDALADVDTTTALPVDGQYMGYDATLGVWRPMQLPVGGANIVEHVGTIAYPAGMDNGWTHTETLATPWVADATANTSSTTAGAKVGEFTLTSAMLAALTDTGTAPYIPRLFFVMYGLYSGSDASRQVRAGLRINGVEMSNSLAVTSITANAGQSIKYVARLVKADQFESLQVGDLVEVYAWKTSGLASTTWTISWFGLSRAAGDRPKDTFDTPSVVRPQTGRVSSVGAASVGTCATAALVRTVVRMPTSSALDSADRVEALMVVM